LLIFFAFKTVEFDTLAAAGRIREIECAINELAGEKILVWETDHGLYAVNYAARFKPFRDGLKRLLLKCLWWKKSNQNTRPGGGEIFYAKNFTAFRQWLGKKFPF
jgi:hypothetical protein